MLTNSFIRKNINSFAIFLFLIIFIFINLTKPSFLYNRDGTLRQFGLGQKRKTVIPIWLLSIVLGILSYLAILYYISIPKLR
jgi:hypothetical protein